MSSVEHTHTHTYTHTHTHTHERNRKREIENSWRWFNNDCCIEWIPCELEQLFVEFLFCCRSTRPELKNFVALVFREWTFALLATSHKSQKFSSFMSICALHYLSDLFKSGVLKILVLAYPQIKFVSLCIPQINFFPFAYPQIKNSTQKSFFWVYFFNFCTPCELLTYPRLRTAGLSQLLSFWNTSIEQKYKLGPFMNKR
jgi:hypothetical protein